MPIHRTLRATLRATLLITVTAWLGACGGDGAAPAASAQLAGSPPARTAAAAAAAAPGLPTQRLTATADGAGRVFSVPAGLDCSGSCSADFELGRSVSLRAVPAAGHVFVGWEGSCSEPTACTVTLDAARQVTARFVALDPLATCHLPRSQATVPTVAAGHPKILLNHAELKACLQRQLGTGAPMAARVKSLVDSQMAGANNYGFEPWFAALVYQATADSRYADFAIALTDAFVRSEEALIAAGQRASVAGDSYLEVGERIGGLATVYDWTHARLTATQRARWVAYANQAVSNVWNPNDARWGGRLFTWSGWSVDNPANNYYYSFLRATMLLGLATHGENPRAQEWLDRFRTDKIEHQLLPLFNAQLQGGGSREGTGYGTAMRSLWLLYDWWERSTGERIATRTPHTLASMAHLLHSMTPTLDRLAPTGDHARDSTAALFDYHRDYLAELIALFPDERLSAVAKSALDASTVPRMRYGFDTPADWLYAMPQLPQASLSELSTTYWGSGTGQLMMRSGWDTDATFANVICGPYTESHAHRDQGSFVLFRGDWLAWDGNIRSASGIEQGEELHNLVRLVRADGSTIRQVVESSPCQLQTLADNAWFTYAVADVTPVYNGQAGVNRVLREVLFLRPGGLVVVDRVQTGTGVQKRWTLNLPQAPTLTPGRIRMLQAGRGLDVWTLAPAAQTGSWVANARVELADNTAGASLFLNVLGGNGAVLDATRSDLAGQPGARITLADGRVATLRLAPDAGVGGQLDLRDATGSVLFSGALPQGVTVPPLFTDTPPPPPPPPTPLVVTVQSPTAGAVFTAPATVTVSGSVAPPEGVQRVELWRNGQKVADDTSAPYAMTLDALPAGTHVLQLRAVAADGRVAVSDSVSVRVDDPAPAPVQLSLRSPAAGARIVAGTTTAIEAQVQGTVPVARIDFLASGLPIGSRTQLPWTLDWTPALPGTVTLGARATLADGRTVIAPAVSVEVVAAPPPPPPPQGGPVVVRQGLGGYDGVLDLSVSNQYVQYNGGRGVVSNDGVSGAYRISGTGGYEVRTFLRFGGLDALRGRRVLKAELALTFNWGAAGYTLLGEVLARDWQPADAAFGWASRTSTQRWARPGSGGADWMTGKRFRISGFTGAEADLRKVLLDTAVVQRWIDEPASNRGVLLRPNTAGKVSWLRSSEDANPDYRPTLLLWLE